MEQANERGLDLTQDEPDEDPDQPAHEGLDLH